MPSYLATFVDGRIEWGPAGPPEVPSGTCVEVHVPTVSKLSDAERARAAFVALSKLAEIGGGDCFGDPVEWQRAVRKDRPLPWDE